MWLSALTTASRPDDLELIVYRDFDDPSPWMIADKMTIICGDRIVLSRMWNECWKKARGDIFMHCADDIVFQTPAWDDRVREAFDAVPDRIAFVHGDDGYWGDRFGTHGFLSREWTDIIGHFVPPYFSSDYNDTWLNEVANMIDRRVFIPIVTEHMHPAFGKGPMDVTHRERLQRHLIDDCDARYVALDGERAEWANRLRAVIRSST